MPIRVVSLQERPELEAGFWSPELVRAWPPFMLQDPTAALYFSPGYFAQYRAFALVAVDEAAPDTVIARACSVPFFLGEERSELPDSGWDGVLRWADSDSRRGRTPNAVSALEIVIRPDRAGQALSGLLVRAMRENARKLGYPVLYAPVRPNEKQLYPTMSMPDYLNWKNEDGLPHDPWLRVHLRLGGEVERIAPCSMTIAATLKQWRGWTGLPFDESGELLVPGALTPVHVSLTHDHAVYVEPNVWVRHNL